MKKIEKDFSTSLAAALPLFFGTFQFQRLFLTGSLVALGFWLTAFLTRLTAPLFPSRLRALSFCLWLAGLGQIAFTTCRIAPLWLAGLYLLFRESQAGSPLSLRAFWGKIFWQGFGFWTLMTYLAIGHEILGSRFQISIFQSLVGTFFLLTVWSLLFKPGASFEKN